MELSIADTKARWGRTVNYGALDLPIAVHRRPLSQPILGLLAIFDTA